MTSKDELEHILSKTLTEFSMPELGEKYSGKVRDMYKQSRGGNDELILITTDRLSAFDSILGAVPFKGQILNQLSLFWFEQVKDIGICCFFVWVCFVFCLYIIDRIDDHIKNVSFCH